MRFVFIAMMLVVAVAVSACGAKKLIVRNCEKAGNAELYVCDKL